MRLETNEYVFNPYQITDDKHGGSKLGMKAVFSETFVNERTLSCAFHMEQSVKNHKKYVTKESREFYANFCNSLKLTLQLTKFLTQMKLYYLV